MNCMYNVYGCKQKEKERVLFQFSVKFHSANATGSAQVFQYQQKNCLNLCGIHRLLYPKDTCQCDSACQAANDCCPDFLISCPDVAKNKDNRIASCHHTSTTLVGMQVVDECPEKSDADLTSKCGAAEHNIRRINIMTDDILVSLPVTTGDNVTYANLYCARCHGELLFEFWTVEITKLSQCFEIAFKTKYERNTFDAQSWKKDNKYSKCQARGDLLVKPPVRLRLWIKEYKGTSHSRFSKLCLSDDYFLSCPYDEEADFQTFHTEKDDKNNLRRSPHLCRHNYSMKYDLCEAWYDDLKHLEKCSLCPDNVTINSTVITHCDVWNEFPQARLYSGYFYPLGKTKLFGYHLMRIGMIVNGAESHMWHGSHMTKNHIYNCSKSWYCEFNNGSRARCGNDTRHICSFPNPIIGECTEYPCGPIVPNECVDTQKRSDEVCFKKRHINDWEYTLSEYLLLISIISLVSTIILYLVIPELRNVFCYYQINCYSTYLASNTFLFISAAVSSVKVACIVSAIFLHFALLSSFSWMAVTSFYTLKVFYALNHQIGNVAGNGNGNNLNSGDSKMGRIIAHLIGHFVPGLFVVSCVLWDASTDTGISTYGQGSFCWINEQQHLLNMFIIPTGFVLLINILIFLGCVYNLASFRWRNNTLPRHAYMAFVLVKLLIGSGVQWVFGVVAHFFPENELVQYIFTILVASHGILILITTLLQRVVLAHIADHIVTIKVKVSNLLF